jgi:hypothetical protein
MKKIQSPGHGEIYTLTLKEVKKLPVGTLLYDLTGREVVLNEDINENTFFDNDFDEMSVFFVRDPWNHPLKDLFLIFKLIE